MNPNRREFLKAFPAAVAALSVGQLPVSDSIEVLACGREEWINYLQGLQRYLVISSQELLPFEEFCKRVLDIELTPAQINYLKANGFD